MKPAPEAGYAVFYSFAEGAGTSVCDRLLPGRCLTLNAMKPGFWATQDPPLSTGPLPTGPLKLHTATPCRLADTRGPAGPAGGPALSANGTRSF